jgi:hypothetical protein
MDAAPASTDNIRLYENLFDGSNQSLHRQRGKRLLRGDRNGGDE